MSAMRATGIIGARRIERQRQLGPGNVDARHADAVGGAVAEGEAAAGKPDAAEHRRQHDRRPIGLLAVMRALQRPCAGDHAARRRRRGARDRGCVVGGDAGDGGRPVRVFRHAVVEAQQIAAEASRSRCSGAPGIARRMRSSTSSVCAIASIMRGVGVRPDRNPLRAEEIGRVGFERADRDELDAGILGAAQPHFHRCERRRRRR